MMGGGSGNYGHLAQRANPNIADPMQNMNKSGAPNLPRRRTMGGAGQGGGAAGGGAGGPFGPQPQPATDQQRRMQPTQQQPAYQQFQADKGALRGIAPGQERAQARATQRRDFERQQFTAAGGDPSKFQTFGQSAGFNQQYDDPAARNQAINDFYQQQFSGIQPQQQAPAGNPVPPGGMKPTPMPQGQLGNFNFQDIMAKLRQGQGPQTTQGGGK